MPGEPWGAIEAQRIAPESNGGQDTQARHALLHERKMLAALKAHARTLKKQTLTVYFAARDPRTPMAARVLAACVAAYALSPIDLIPDFIPVLGYLDDLILIPLGLAAVIRLTPPAVIADAQQRAEHATRKPVSYLAAAFIISIWLLALALFARWLLHIAGQP